MPQARVPVKVRVAAAWTLLYVSRENACEQREDDHTVPVSGMLWVRWIKFGSTALTLPPPCTG